MFDVTDSFECSEYYEEREHYGHHGSDEAKEGSFGHGLCAPTGDIDGQERKQEAVPGEQQEQQKADNLACLGGVPPDIPSKLGTPNSEAAANVSSKAHSPVVPDSYGSPLVAARNTSPDESSPPI